MNIKPIKLKSLILFVGGTLLVGGIGALLGGNTEKYANMVKPPLAPSPAVFPVVWGILYMLIGVGAYIIANEKGKFSETALKFYWAQLLCNMLWPLIFWRFEALTFAAIWIGIIILLTGFLIYFAYKVCKTVLYFFAPYILWLLFALYLNIGFAVLN